MPIATTADSVIPRMVSPANKASKTTVAVRIGTMGKTECA